MYKKHTQKNAVLELTTLPDTIYLEGKMSISSRTAASKNERCPKALWDLQEPEDKIGRKNRKNRSPGWLFPSYCCQVLI